MLLLLGQRRTETALMRWRDVDLAAGVWTVPAEITKSGRAASRAVAAAGGRDPEAPAAHGRERRSCSPAAAAPMTGWSKRLPAVYEATAEAGMAPWSLHDLRRTMRTGLGRLGVDPDRRRAAVEPRDLRRATAIYDRAEYWQQRVEAAARWADHVIGEGGHWSVRER